MLYLAFFILFIIILLFLVTLRINILIEYLRNGNDDHFIISLFILNEMLKLKYEIPFIEIEKNGIKFVKFKKKNKKEKDIKKEEEKINFNKIYENYLLFKSYYMKNKDLINKIKKYLKKSLVLKELDISIEFGTGNACYTGVLSGNIWAALGIITSFISTNIKVLKQRVIVKPDFANEKLKIDLYCIFVVKFVHIIVVGVIVIKEILYKKVSLKKALGGDLVG